MATNGVISTEERGKVHSSTPNAGQKYASARKHGVTGKTLAALRAGMRTRDRAQTDRDVAREAEVASRIAFKNKMHRIALGLNE